MKEPKRKTNYSQIPATYRTIRAQQKYMEIIPSKEKQHLEN